MPSWLSTDTGLAIQKRRSCIRSSPNSWRPSSPDNRHGTARSRVSWNASSGLPDLRCSGGPRLHTCSLRFVRARAPGSFFLPSSRLVPFLWRKTDGGDGRASRRPRLPDCPCPAVGAVDSICVALPPGLRLRSAERCLECFHPSRLWRTSPPRPGTLGVEVVALRGRDVRAALWRCVESRATLSQLGHPGSLRCRRERPT